MTRAPRPSSNDALSVASPVAARGRPRSFDVDVAMDRGIETFRRLGYEATSVDDLTAAIGIGRSSFYACFGSKHAMLLRAIDVYRKDAIERCEAAAAAADTPARAVAALLETIVDPDGGRDGCLLHNCISELAPRDPEVDARTSAHMEDLAALVKSYVRAARPRGAERATAALVTGAMGALTMRKVGYPPEVIRGTLATLCGALLAA